MGGKKPTCGSEVITYTFCILSRKKMPQWVKWQDQKQEDLDLITRTHRVNL